MLGLCWSIWQRLLAIHLSGMDQVPCGLRSTNGALPFQVDPFSGHSSVRIIMSGDRVELDLILMRIKIGLTSYSFTIPKNTPDGQYLLRIEHLAVHNAANYGGAQFFVACGQVKITGGGGGTPGPLVSFPGAYSANDPGIFFNNYYPAVSWHAAWRYRQ